MANDLVLYEEKAIEKVLDDYLSAQGEDKKMMAITAFLDAANERSTNNPSKDFSAMYELALYQFASILDELGLNKDQHKTKMATINHFMEKYFKRAGYDVDKMFGR